MSDQDVWVLRGEVLGLDRSVGPKDGAVRGPYAELDGAKINARTPEDLDHFGLKNDAAPAAVEIMRRALEDVDVPAASAQEVAGEQPAERPADDQGPPLLGVIRRSHGMGSFSRSDPTGGAWCEPACRLDDGSADDVRSLRADHHDPANVKMGNALDGPLPNGAL